MRGNLLKLGWLTLALSSGALATDRPQAAVRVDADAASHDLAKLQFRSGAFAAIKDLEFLYAFNLGGTLTESSNYDAAPPVPPSYGIWKKTGPNQFAARYEFYLTKAPTTVQGSARDVGWMPAGRGVLRETITLSGYGRSFTSTIHYDVYDKTDKPTHGGGAASGQGTRIMF